MSFRRESPICGDDQMVAKTPNIAKRLIMCYTKYLINTTMLYAVLNTLTLHVCLLTLLYATGRVRGSCLKPEGTLGVLRCEDYSLINNNAQVLFNAKLFI